VVFIQTIPKSPEVVQSLGMRAGIVVNVTREDRRQPEAIVSDRTAKACMACQHHQLVMEKRLSWSSSAPQLAAHLGKSAASTRRRRPARLSAVMADSSLAVAT